MSDRNDGYAKLVNALTASVVAFKDKDLDLYEQSKDALQSVLRDAAQKPEVPAEIQAEFDAPVRLIPWKIQVQLIADLDDRGYGILVDGVDIGSRFATHDEANSAYWAVQNAVDRISKFTLSAARTYHEMMAEQLS